MPAEKEKPHLTETVSSRLHEIVTFPKTIKCVEADRRGLEFAKHITADRYNDHAPDLNYEEVYDKLCPPERYNKDFSITLVAMQRKKFAAKREVIGTLQFTFGENVEAMDLMKVPEEFHEKEKEMLGEFGRFAVKRDYYGSRSSVLSALTKKGLELAAKERGIKVDKVVAIMPEAIRRFYEAEGIHLQPVDGAELNEENPVARETFDSFPRYWRRQNPKGKPQLYVYPESLIAQYRK